MTDTAVDPIERDARIATFQSAEREAAAADLAWVLSTIQGRRFIDTLRRDTGIRASSFRPDPYEMAFNEGRRSVGLELEARLVAPSLAHLFDLMEKEHRDRIRDRNSFLDGAE